MFSWKLNGKPQAKKPSYGMPGEYDWIDNHYKKYLEKKLICDTLIAIAKKIISGIRREVMFTIVNDF